MTSFRNTQNNMQLQWSEGQILQTKAALIVRYVLDFVRGFPACPHGRFATCVRLQWGFSRSCSEVHWVSLSSGTAETARDYSLAGKDSSSRHRWHVFGYRLYPCVLIWPRSIHIYLNKPISVLNIPCIYYFSCFVCLCITYVYQSIIRSWHTF